MCEKCSAEIHVPATEVYAAQEAEETTRLYNIRNQVSVLAVSESRKITPVAEMMAACGCGACGLCRTAFMGGIISKAVSTVRNIFKK